MNNLSFDNLKSSTTDLLQQKIQEIAAIASELPSIVIIHSLYPQVALYMSPKGREILMVTQEELTTMGEKYNQRFFNPEDLAEFRPQLYALLEKNDEAESVSFFHQVRPTENHPWSWYLGTSKIFMKNEAGRPTHMITLASPVEALHHVTNKVNRLLEENSFLRRNHEIFASLTKREKEILKLLALGDSSGDIASKLNISEQTASTHRRNIKSKLNIQTAYEFTRFAQAFDLI